MSQGVYKISAVSDQTRDYPSQYGDMTVYWVKLENAEAEVPAGAFELHKKQSSKAPEVGNEIDVQRFERGEFNNTPFVRIRPVFKDNRGGGGGKGYNDPETVARISRSHSQEMALRFVAAAGDLDKLDPAERATADAYLSTVLKPLVDWFDKDKAEAGKAAGQQSQQVSFSDGGEVPADTSGMSNGAASQADETIPF